MVLVLLPIFKFFAYSKMLAARRITLQVVEEKYFIFSVNVIIVPTVLNFVTPKN